MNKYEKKLDKAITLYKTENQNPKHDSGWIYKKLNQGYEKGKISLKHLEKLCTHFITALMEDEYGR